TGIDSLAAVFVMIAGISGAIMGTYIFKVLRLDTNVGCGVAMGSASHAIGTSKSLENSLEQGSISTIAMILSALFVSVLAPILVMAVIYYYVKNLSNKILPLSNQQDIRSIYLF